MRVSNLVRCNPVYEGQEWSSLIFVTRQRRDGGQAHLLSYVISRETTAFRSAHPCPAVPDNEGADDLQHLPECVPIAGYCFSNDSIETFSRNCHREQALQRYVGTHIPEGWWQLQSVPGRYEFGVAQLNNNDQEGHNPVTEGATRRPI